MWMFSALLIEQKALVMRKMKRCRFVRSSVNGYLSTESLRRNVVQKETVRLERTGTRPEAEIVSAWIHAVWPWFLSTNRIV